MLPLYYSLAECLQKATSGNKTQTNYKCRAHKTPKTSKNCAKTKMKQNRTLSKYKTKGKKTDKKAKKKF